MKINKKTIINLFLILISYAIIILASKELIDILKISEFNFKNKLSFFVQEDLILFFKDYILILICAIIISLIIFIMYKVYIKVNKENIIKLNNIYFIILILLNIVIISVPLFKETFNFDKDYITTRKVYYENIKKEKEKEDYILSEFSKNISFNLLRKYIFLDSNDNIDRFEMSEFVDNDKITLFYDKSIPLNYLLEISKLEKRYREENKDKEILIANSMEIDLFLKDIPNAIDYISLLPIEYREEIYKTLDIAYDEFIKNELNPDYEKINSLFIELSKKEPSKIKKEIVDIYNYDAFKEIIKFEINLLKEQMIANSKKDEYYAISLYNKIYENQYKNRINLYMKKLKIQLGKENITSDIVDLYNDYINVLKLEFENEEDLEKNDFNKELKEINQFIDKYDLTNIDKYTDLMINKCIKK